MADQPAGSKTQGEDPEPSAPSWRILVRMLALVAVLLLALFLSAGTFAWPMAWVYVIITVIMTIGSRLLLLRRNPDLAAERAAYAEKEDAAPLSGGSHRRAGRIRRTLTCG